MKTVTLAVGCMFSVILAFSGSIHADQPVPVFRTFAFLGEPGLGDHIPNFLGDESITVTVLPKVTDPTNETYPIVEKNADGTYTISIWHRHPAHYATKGGKKYQGVFLWKETSDPATQTPPPVGSHTFTGPNGLIINAELPMGLRICESGLECPPGTNGNAWTFVPAGFQDSRTIVVVEAIFSR